MFPDHEICSKFQMSETKCAYTKNYGIASYFKKVLVKDIQSSQFYYVLFDESSKRQIECYDRNKWTFRLVIGTKIQV